VGTRALVEVVEREYPRDAFVRHLASTTVVARGPKPLAVLRELQVPVAIAVPEPNTWRELLAAIDAHAGDRPLDGARVAVQEYGVSNPELLDGLASRGASVMRVPVYRWALPDDIRPLQEAVRGIAEGRVEVIVFTTGVQLQHLWRVARDMNLESALGAGCARAVIGSIGPTTSEEIRRHGLVVDLEASHPKFGILIRELALRAGALLHLKRRSEGTG
jgi:uroporphyrinogen-III synthase